MCDIHRHNVIYYIAQSDLHRWKGNNPEAREYVKKAKDLCIEKGYFKSLAEPLEDRMKLLKPDTIDEILEMYEGINI